MTAPDDLERLLEHELDWPATMRTVAEFVRAREASAYGKGFSTVEDRYDRARHERDEARIALRDLVRTAIQPISAVDEHTDELAEARAECDRLKGRLAIFRVFLHRPGRDLPGIGRGGRWLGLVGRRLVSRRLIGWRLVGRCLVGWRRRSLVPTRRGAVRPDG